MADNAEKAADKPVDKKPPEMVEEEPVVTHHEASGLKYTVTTGRMPLKNKEGEIEAQVFFVAYTLDEAARRDRPLMFSFNGGPGSPSLWLHLGALGPKRIPMRPDIETPKPPYRLEENPLTWLADTDLVFIDPVGTGYSRGKTLEISEKHWGLKGDVEGVAEFIRLYLTRYERWASPLFLVGESYGTTRAAGLSGYLMERGVAFNGVVLVSSILNFQTARFTKGNDLPYLLFLPTYTATAWYHGALDPDLQSKPLAQVLDEVEQWAKSTYVPHLMLGDLAGDVEAVTRDLARFTGLSEEYVAARDRRVKIHAFCKELLRRQRRTVGRLDSRFKGIDSNAGGEHFEHDPSMSGLMPPYTAAFNDYVRTELGYKTDLEYVVFRGIEKPWNWGSAGDGHPDTSAALRDAMSKNPHMKVFVASGYFDLATPYFATEFTLAHMGLEPELRANITTCEYEAGHMMYIHEPSLEKLHTEVRKFIRESV